MVGTFKKLPMTGFELRFSGVGSDRSTNCDTTTAHQFLLFWMGQTWPLFVYFWVFSHENIAQNWQRWWKHRCCAWDSNPERQDGKYRQIHWATAAPLKILLLIIFSLFSSKEASRQWWRCVQVNASNSMAVAIKICIKTKLLFGQNRNFWLKFFPLPTIT